MTIIRSPLQRLPLLAGLGCALLALTLEPPCIAQSGTASPAGAPTTPAGTTNPAPKSSGMAYTDAKGRHLAPRGTFYLLSYVSAKTDRGVEGFDPGQEVHLVEVHRPTHTLVVSDGHAQVEVPPAKLTNDMDIATLVREKDQAKQAQIAAYIQSEQTAYEKEEKEAAEATAKDLARRQQPQVAQIEAAEQTPPESTPQPVQASADYAGNYSGNGYYGEGGYGYGSPYSYLVEVPAPAAPAPAAAPAAPAPNKVAAPPGRRK